MKKQTKKILNKLKLGAKKRIKRGRRVQESY